MKKEIKILIVDDEPDNLQIIEDVFTKANSPYSILKSPNGRIALNLAEKKIPNLIITDWDMPEMDGVQLIQELKRMPKTDHIPVIMCTGVMTTSANLQTALDAGAADYIRKPVDSIELIARTNSMLKMGEYIKQIRENNRVLEINYQTMKKMASTDPLTQISNRRDFLSKIEYEMAVSERKNSDFTLVIGDIDHFKQINDRYGHDCGDQVLVTVAKKMQEVIRKQDYIGRWGGEEFILLFPETDLDGGSKISEKIREHICQHPFQINDQTFHISMTFGISQLNSCKNIHNCLKLADQALYRGKEAGRNRVVIA